MWICLNDAFVSAVQDRNRPDYLVVRARKRQHLKLLFPDVEVIDTPDADYACRVFVSKQQFIGVLSQRVEDIGYPNFKNSAHEHELHDLYSGFWQAHWAYQQRGDKD
jgi:hypothetical protein